MGGAVLVMQDQCFSDCMVGILRRLSSMDKPRARGVRWGCSDQATVSIKGDGWVFGVCIGEGWGGGGVDEIPFSRGRHEAGKECETRPHGLGTKHEFLLRCL